MTQITISKPSSALWTATFNNPPINLIDPDTIGELQELLAASVHAIEDGLTLIRREFPTDIGPIDIVCRDADGCFVAIEVKRRGEIDGVEQLVRYIERLRLDSSLGEIRGVFVAQQVKPQARVLATDRGITWLEVDYDELRGIESNELRLF